MKTLTIIIKLIVSIILLQTLYFKFTASAESVYIFSTLGLEPFGRIGIGIAELVAAILIFPSRTSVYGALLSTGLMAGAIFSHLTKLGIVVMNDGGQLFFLAVTVFILSTFLIFVQKDKLLLLLKKKLQPNFQTITNNN